MERSRSKRSYYYDQDSDSQTPPPPPRPKLRYDAGGGGGGGARRTNHHRRGPDRRAPPPPPPLPPPPPPPLPLPSSSSSKPLDDSPPPSAPPTTVFRILCPDIKAGGVIGKSGSIIRSFRQDTGAWINVHHLVPGDDERIIETSDSRRREPDGRPPQYSPAQEALLLIHERILEVDFEMDGIDGEQDNEYGSWSSGGRERDRGRVTTRLVVPRIHVGCLLGKAGKIIEQMRMETKTHIRILPRDQYTPRCVSATEEIVQVVGDGNGVKKAVAIISSRLKESLHRDRGPFRGRIHSPDHYFLPDEEFMNNAQHGSDLEGPDLGPRPLAGQTRGRRNAYGPEHSFDQDADPLSDFSRFPCEAILFRILCPSDKVESVFARPDGIIDLLCEVVGVDVSVSEPMPGSDERVIVITSEERPDDELFPAQEALLHIQTHIVDLGPDNDNIIKTRLLVSSSDVGCLEGRDGALAEIRRLTNANVQILSKDYLPPCAMETDVLVQIVGDIRAARNALVHVTEKLRSYLYCDISGPKDMLPPSISTPSHVGSINAVDSGSPIRSSAYDGYQGRSIPVATYQNIHPAATTWQLKDSGGCATGSLEKEENTNDEGRQSALRRFSGPIVTKSTLEVIIPKHAVPSLTMRSGSKLSQISEMSGATVTLIEDRPEQTEKIVKISGSPEQAERAQSLLQGFILSTQDDFPSS